MEIEQIAEVCHEANRTYCRSQGDLSHKLWTETPWSIKQSAIAGVVFLQENPDAPLEALHEKWREHKKANGWVFGEEKDDLTKTHPCMLPYADLPKIQQVKDALFRTIVRALTSGETNA